MNSRRSTMLILKTTCFRSPSSAARERRTFFSDNGGIDIYALDTRAANALSLERDNQFKGHEAMRIRQDWFGLVRVEDSDGQGMPDAEVTVRDITGATLVTFTTSATGYGPATADPSRSQGLSPFEDGGPVPTWQRFTEFVVDGKGRRVESTPHTLLAEAAGETGCAIYSWDGLPGKTSGFHSTDGRYQIALVILGSTCSSASLVATSRRARHPAKTLSPCPPGCP